MRSMLDCPVHTCFLLILLLLILPGRIWSKEGNLSTLALRCALGESLIFFFLFPILWVDDTPDAVAICWVTAMIVLFLLSLGLTAARFTRFKPAVMLFAFLPIMVLLCIRCFDCLFLLP